MAETALYLYGIIKGPLSNKNILGLDNRSVIEAISLNDITAVVSCVNLDEFGEIPLKRNLESMDWLKEKAFNHEKVIEKVLTGTCIIPIKFCTIFKTPEGLASLLKEKYEYFLKLLEEYKGYYEWGVKISASIKPVALPLTPAACGKEYLRQKKRQYDLAVENERRINTKVKKVFEKVNALANDSRINRPTPKELLTNKDKEQVLNASFLVAVDKAKELIGLINELAGEYKDLIIALAGPLPVYSFIGELNGS